MSTFSRLILAALALPTIGAADWSAKFHSPCPRCRSAADVRRAFPALIPTRAILYFRAGEFATHVPEYHIDLDTGRVSSFEAHRAAAATLGSLSTSQLDKVRQASLRAWGLRPPHTILFSPGADEELSILNGSRMITFHPDERNVTFLTAIVDDAIKSVSKAD